MQETEYIRWIMEESFLLKQKMLSDTSLISGIVQVVDLMVTTYKSKGKVLFCGNGGSAADAQHLAAELTGRFYKDRSPLFAEALHVNTSYMTAVANDYGYDVVFERLVTAMGGRGDILYALSTSGNSPNIIRAIEAAKQQEMKVVGMTGSKPSRMDDICDILIKVPSENTPRIQEAHMLIGHIVCCRTEEILFPDEE